VLLQTVLDSFNIMIFRMVCCYGQY